MKNLRELSLRIEQETGYDSIQTIEEHYGAVDWVDGHYVHRAMYQCVVPNCNYRRKSARAMWLHVHTSKAHDPVPEIVAALADDA